MQTNYQYGAKGDLSPFVKKSVYDSKMSQAPSQEKSLNIHEGGSVSNAPELASQEGLPRNVIDTAMAEGTHGSQPNT